MKNLFSNTTPPSHPSDSSWEYVGTTNRHYIKGTRKSHSLNAKCPVLYTNCEVWSFLQASYAFLKAHNVHL